MGTHIHIHTKDALSPAAVNDAIREYKALMKRIKEDTARAQQLLKDLRGAGYTREDLA